MRDWGVLFLLPPTRAALSLFARIGIAVLLGLCVFAAADAARLAGRDSDQPPLPWSVLLVAIAAVCATNFATEVVFMVAQPWARFGV